MGCVIQPSLIMRDKKRIKIILSILEEIWERNPDFRFGQLLINLRIIKDDFETWQNEDDLLEEYLTKIKDEEQNMV